MLERFNKEQTLILGAVAGVLFAVAGLEMSGKIKHSTHKDNFDLATYQAVAVTEEDQYRLSAKDSNERARCYQGFLFIESGAQQALLVNHKNRGVRCDGPAASLPPSE